MENIDKINICFLICGLPRSIDLVINNIENIIDDTKYNVNYYISSSLNNNQDKEYFNNFDIHKLNNYKNIKKILLFDDIIDNSYRNSINYLNRIYYGVKLLETTYDIYLIIRSDCIIHNFDFLSNINKNSIYFSNTYNNIYSYNISKKINEQLIISTNFNLLNVFFSLQEFIQEKNNRNYADIMMYNFIQQYNVKYKIIEIDYKLILSKCNIIAISGDSGSGKSTLMNYLMNLFGNENMIKFETDRYHKWERGDDNYKIYTHLNPYSNHLEVMKDDIYNLKIGNQIYQVDYDHNTGKFTNKQKIENKENLIICGLHTLYNDKLNEILDIKIYMDTDRNLIKKWKILRDTSERNYTLEKILKQIDDREKDYFHYIHDQKEKSDIIIHFYEEEESILKCKFIIKNKEIFKKLSEYLIKYHYLIYIDNDNIIIHLRNKFYDICVNENIIINYNIDQDIQNNYYYEILILFILFISK
jgi:uridine kinase